MSIVKNITAAHNYKDSVLYVTGDPSGSMSILYTDDPQSGNWHATPAILHDLQDPDLFIDDDGEAYMFWGLVYDKHELLLKGLTRNQGYYFAIEAFNEKGWRLFPDSCAPKNQPSSGCRALCGYG